MLTKSLNTKKFIFSLPETLHIRWKLASAKTGATMNDFLIAALESQVGKHLGNEQLTFNFQQENN